MIYKSGSTKNVFARAISGIINEEDPETENLEICKEIFSQMETSQIDNGSLEEESK